MMDKLIDLINQGGTGEYDARQERGEAVALPDDFMLVHKAWAPVMWEVERRCDKECGLDSDFTVTVTAEEMRAINSAPMPPAYAHPPADDARVAELEAQLAASDRHGVYLEELTDAQADRIAGLEAQLAASREREGRMRELLEDMRYELHQYTEGFDVIWGRVDDALAAEKEQTK